MLFRSEPESNNPCFDSDDGFDELLSQIEMPQTVSLKNLHQHNPSVSLTCQSKSSGLPRLKSADHIKPEISRLRTPSGTIMKSWQNTNAAQSKKKICSKAEIEAKRLAAIKKRAEKTKTTGKK